MRAFVAVATLASSLVAMADPAGAAAAAPPGVEALDIAGGPVTGISFSPAALQPSFAPGTSDYVLPCAPGGSTFAMTVTTAGRRRISVGRRSGRSLTIPVGIGEGQLLRIRSTGASRRTWWVRCLPSDFPARTVASTPGGAPGWYLTPPTIAPTGTPYLVIADERGTPVWFRRQAGPTVFFESHGTGVLTTMPFLAVQDLVTTGFRQSTLDGRVVGDVAAVGITTDHHELLRLPDGGAMVLSYDVRTGVDLRAAGKGASEPVFDCVVQDLDAAGRLRWEWRATDHIRADEMQRVDVLASARTGTAYDSLHCNSIDVAPDGDVLVSFRHTNSLYLIDRETKAIRWKLGGSPTPERLEFVADPLASVTGQHDARFVPGGDVLLFDNRSFSTDGAARAVQYRIDEAARTATLVRADHEPAGRRSVAMGSARRLPGGGTLAGWGLRLPGGGYTEYDAAGRVVLDVAFPAGVHAYRTVKEPKATFDADLLRMTAGRELPPSDLLLCRSLAWAKGQPWARVPAACRARVRFRG